MEDPLLTKVKQTVQSEFRLAVKKDYDSLRLISPTFLESNSDADFRFRLKAIFRVAQSDGIPDISDLKVSSFDPNATNFCTLVLIPKSADKLGIDSIVFEFHKFTGADKIAILVPYFDAKNIYTLPPKTN